MKELQEEMREMDVLDNFEGAMVGNYHIKDNNIFMELKKEKPTFGYRNKKFDYNLHFHFGLRNRFAKKNNVNIFIECKNEKGLNQELPRLWISDNVDKEYMIDRNINGKTDFFGKYFFTLRLNGKQTLYIANFPPIRFSRLKKTFKDLSTKSNAKEVSLGKTVENRPIKAYEYGDINHKPVILLVSGFHPPERDTVAIESIMEKFLDDRWKRRVLQNYSFSLIPILNPDGFANAMQGSNINEINFHWKFFGNSMEKCPECHSIWKYCSEIKPIVFFDFHAFTFQNNEARPYWIPKGYYGGKKAKIIQNNLNTKLKELCDGGFSKGEDIFAPTLLSTGLRNEFGTITAPKFHLHMKDGIDESKRMAIICLEIILRILRKYGINSSAEILKKPYGKVKISLLDKISIKTLNFWYFKLKPFLRYFYSPIKNLR